MFRMLLLVVFLALMAPMYFGPNPLESMFYVVAGFFLTTAFMVLLDWVRNGKGFVIASRTNYIFWLLVDVVLSIVAGLYNLLSHHPVMCLLALPLIAICVPFVVPSIASKGSGVLLVSSADHLS